MPALSVTVNVMIDPAGKSAVPVMVGVVLFSGVSSSRVNSGAVVSITPVLSFIVVLLPASSVAMASTV